MNKVDRLKLKLKNQGVQGSPVIFVYRNDSGRWVSDITEKEYDEEDEAVSDVKEIADRKYRDAMIIVDDCDQ